VRLENEKNIFNTDCNNNAGERGRMHENNNNYNTPAFDYRPVTTSPVTTSPATTTPGFRYHMMSTKSSESRITSPNTNRQPTGGAGQWEQRFRF